MNVMERPGQRSPATGPRSPQRLGQPSAQFDPSILSRMVTVNTAAATAGAGVMPIRITSMQDFRRSMNLLNTVPETSRRQQQQQPNQVFYLTNRRSTMTTVAPGGGGGGSRPMSSDNPLLKMMEQRMAASATTTTAAGVKERPRTTSPAAVASATPAMAPMSESTRTALQASINKWSGARSPANTDQGEQGNRTNIATNVGSRPTSRQGSPSGRVPLSSSQILLLQQLTSQPAQLEDVRKGQSIPQNSAHHNMVNAQQASAIAQPVLSPDQPSTLGVGQVPGPGYARPSLTRCAASSAEVDRLRRQNMSIQMRQQLLMEEHALQQQRAIEQANIMNQRNVAASTLMSMQNNGLQSMAHQDLHQLQVNTLNNIKKLPSSRTMRKRRSDVDDEDDDVCSKGSSNCSRTQSMSSSTSSKVHRTFSHNSVRATLGSMDDLRIKSSASILGVGSRGSLRNQSFSSGRLNVAGSHGRLNMANQSFSSGSHSNASRRVAPTTTSSQSTLRRNHSSNGWIKSLISKQSTAGKAATTFELTLQSSNNNPAPLTPNKASSPVPEELHSSPKLSPKPIQVEAEECCAPPTERRETVIISAVPDSIKYRDVKPDTRPLDVVKEALSSRGVKCVAKPSMDVEEGFFTKVTDMYDHEIANAIRSSDVEGCRKLISEGNNLQCGNRFGETLIHLACRRSHRDLVSFLINDAGVSLRVRDDFGRTPMHDACWRTEPDLELLDMLLDRAPELLMLSDKRGHTPLDYARREHWAVLVPFLQERASKFRAL